MVGTWKIDESIIVKKLLNFCVGQHSTFSCPYAFINNQVKTF